MSLQHRRLFLDLVSVACCPQGSAETAKGAKAIKPRPSTVAISDYPVRSVNEAIFRQLKATAPPRSPHVPTPKSADATSAGSTKFRSKEPQHRLRCHSRVSPRQPYRALRCRRPAA